MPMRPTLVLTLAAALGVAALATAPPAKAGDDWPQFRGPTGDGLSAAKGLPLAWSESENVRWKTPLPGRGRSSPVVLGDRIWLTTAIEHNPRRQRVGPDDCTVADRVSLGAVCLDRRAPGARDGSGKLLWHVTLFEVDKPAPVHAFNSFATPTPVAEPGRLYCDFGAMGTACLDAATGKTLWTQRLAIDHMVGPGSSPLLVGGLLVLVRDGCDEQYVAALDKQTGQVAWKTPRPPLEGRRDMKKAFSTPLLIEAAGKTQLVVPGAQWLVSYDPATGKEHWRLRHGMGFSLAPRPVFGHGLVYFCTGCFPSHLLAIRLDGQGDVTKSHVAWKVTDRQMPTMSSPILVGKELYVVNDSGQVFCFDSLTGEAVGSARLPGGYLASPVHADGRLYLCAMDGRTTVLRAGRQLEKLGESKLDGVVVASPALLGDALLLRTDTDLYCIGSP